MKKTLLLTAALLAITTGAALAATPKGVNLSWTDCTAQAGTGLNQAAICTSNLTSAKNLYGTYCLPAGGSTSNVVGNDVAMDISVAGPLPCWWTFTAAPRNVGFGVQFNTVCPDGGGVGIFDYWGSIPGGPSGGAAAFTSFASPPGFSKVRIIMTVAIDGSQSTPVPDNTEVYSFTFQLKYNATVGACTGCNTPACLYLANIQVTQSATIPFQINGPSSRDYAFYAGGAIGGPGCPVAVPTQNKTWGSVKALYR